MMLSALCQSGRNVPCSVPTTCIQHQYNDSLVAILPHLELADRHKHDVGEVAHASKKQPVPKRLPDRIDKHIEKHAMVRMYLHACCGAAQDLGCSEALARHRPFAHHAGGMYNRRFPPCIDSLPILRDSDDALAGDRLALDDGDD